MPLIAGPWSAVHDGLPRLVHFPYTGVMRYVIVALAFLVITVPAFVRAAELIPAFDAHVTLHGDGSADVVERISYDFGTNERHGIFRTIPYSYQASSTTYTADISNVKVFNGAGTPVPFNESRANGALTLKIGDPNTVVTGAYTYVLTYTVRGPFLYYPDHDEFYWDVTSSWENAIARANVLVDLPAGAHVLGATCFQGTVGALVHCTNDERLVNADQAGYRATAEALAPTQSFAVDIAFPKGIIAAQHKPWESSATPPWYTFAPIGLPVAALAYVFTLWYTRGRDPARRRIAPRRTAPADVSPAIAGIVYNDRIEPRDIVAEFVRLAVQGFVRIVRTERSIEGVAVHHYAFERTDAPEPDDPVEALVLAQLFAGGSEHGQDGTVQQARHVELSATGPRWPVVRDAITDELYAEVFLRGYFVERPGYVRRWHLILGALALMAGAACTALLNNSWALFLGPAVLASGVLVALAGIWLPVKTVIGSSVKEQLEGYKRYLMTGEGSGTDDQASADVFLQHLPYALALGVTEAWAAQCADSDLPAPAWFSADTSVTPASFASAIRTFVADLAATSGGGSAARTGSVSGEGDW